MRSIRPAWLLLVAVTAVLFATTEAGAAVETAAEHAVIMDAETGQVLWA